ncbi:MAG TPA: alpha/beta fold hydrolase, partial [Thermoanaerobaculia bacterium]
PGDRRLVAYVVAAAERALDVGELRGHLEERLPAALVPSALVVLAALPVAANGKLDRRALPPPETGGGLMAQGAVAPRDALEHELVQVWEEVLGIAPLGVRDDFFRRGGHSLLAVRLMSQVERRLQRRMPLGALFEAPTVERFAALLRREAAGAAPPGPLVEIRPGGAKPPLFLVHPVGGSVLCYAPLVRHLEAGRPVYGLQARGLDGGEAPPATIAAMADDYLAALLAVAPRGPYLLGGWSMGGLVAFEMGRRLQARGEVVAPLLLIDTPPPGCEPPPDAALLAALAADLGVPREAFAPGATGGDGAAGADGTGSAAGDGGADGGAGGDHADRADPGALLPALFARAQLSGSLPPDFDLDQLQRLYRVYRAHHLAMGGYRPVPSALGAVLLCPEAGPRSAPLGGGTGWGPFAVCGVRIEEVPGDHQTMMREPDVRVLAARLDRRLEEAGGSA